MRSFGANSKGGMTVVMVLSIAVLAILTGGVIDYMSLSNQKRDLQGVADRAAGAAAQELVTVKWTAGRVQSVAESLVNASYTAPHQTTAQIIDSGKAVKVSIAADAKAFFPGPFGSVENVGASAIAEIAGGGYVCMIGLDPNAASTIEM